MENSEAINNYEDQHLDDDDSSYEEISLFREVLEDFSDDAREIFENLSDSAKEFATKIYESMETQSDKVLGRVGIAFNQFWIDRHEGKSNKIHEKIVGLDEKINKIDESTNKLTTSMEALKTRGINTDKFERKIEDIQLKKQAIALKREKQQMKYENREEKKNLFVSRRNEIVDRLIGYQEEKLNPIEKKILTMNHYIDTERFNLQINRIKHTESEDNLNTIIRTREEIREAYEESGMSRWRIRRNEALRELDKEIGEAKKAGDKESKTMIKDLEKLTKKKEKVIKQEQKADPYKKRISKLRAIRRSNTNEKVETNDQPEINESEFFKTFVPIIESIMPESKNTTENNKLLSLDEILNEWDEGVYKTNLLDHESFIAFAHELSNNSELSDTRMAKSAFKSIFLSFVYMNNKYGLNRYGNRVYA